MLVKSQVKYIQSLGQKKHRDEDGVFIAEGPKIVAELLVSASPLIRDVFALPAWIETNKLLLAKHQVTSIDESDLAKISQLQTPNQVLAVLEKLPTLAAPVAMGALTLALDTIQDPGNLGTIIRIADWFGIKQIVCSLECADIYNPKVVQSTMGSIMRVAVHYVDLQSWLGAATDVNIYAALLDGKPVGQFSVIKEGVIVIGNESKGIRSEIQALVQHKVTIPRIGQAESLNAAVATGIILSRIVLGG